MGAIEVRSEMSVPALDVAAFIRHVERRARGEYSAAGLRFGHMTTSEAGPAGAGRTRVVLRVRAVDATSDDVETAEVALVDTAYSWTRRTTLSTLEDARGTYSA